MRRPKLFHRLLLVAATLLLVACTSPQPPVAAGDQEGAYEKAVQLSGTSDEAGAVRALRVALERDPDAYQRALVEPAFAGGLRDRDDFREALHEAAVKQKVSSVTLAPEDEPGEWIEVECRCVDHSGAPVAGALAQLFVTDAEGRYHPTIEGERTPRLFATLVSDEDGRFTFRTVRPGSYPGTRNARHIHLSVRKDRLRLAAPSYMGFDDDPLLAEPQNAEQRGEALRIEMRTVDSELRGLLILPMR